MMKEEEMAEVFRSAKVHACAVCGYDVKVFRHGHRKVNPPVILGHKICGEIDQDITIRSILSKKGKDIKSRFAYCHIAGDTFA